MAFENVFWKTPSEKKNVILTVGRLGTKQKNTELLLEAFALSDIHKDYTLKLIGEADEHFHDYLKKYFIKYPDLKCRVEFTGYTDNRQDLDMEYQSAKDITADGTFGTLIENDNLVSLQSVFNSMPSYLNRFAPEEFSAYALNFNWIYIGKILSDNLSA